jgi:branched-chain amino acid transport system substrate-binding protein
LRSRMTKMSGVGVVIVAIALLIFFCAGSVQAENVIKIGIIVPLTGPAGQWGQTVKRTMDINEKIINSQGGISLKGQKYKIEMIYGDDKYTVAGGRAAAEKLFYTNNVDFLMGSVGSESISSWAPLATQLNKLAIVGSAQFTPRKEWPTVFHLSSLDSERSEALAKLMKEEFKCKTVLYIMSDDLVGKLAKEISIKQEKSRGLEVKGYLMVPPTATDFYPYLTRALKDNPDYLHCRLSPGSMALVVKQARELGYKGYIGYPTSMPSDMQKWQSIAGVEASKKFVGMMLGPEEYSPLGLEYLKVYSEVYPKYEITDLAYVMMPHVLKMAIESTQSMDTQVLLDYLRKTEFHSYHKTPLNARGEKTFGIKNHMTVPVPYSVVVGPGQVKYLGSKQIILP